MRNHQIFSEVQQGLQRHLMIFLIFILSRFSSVGIGLMICYIGLCTKNLLEMGVDPAALGGNNRSVTIKMRITNSIMTLFLDRNIFLPPEKQRLFFILHPDLQKKYELCFLQNKNNENLKKILNDFPLLKKVYFYMNSEFIFFSSNCIYRPLFILNQFTILAITLAQRKRRKKFLGTRYIRLNKDFSIRLS